MVGIFYFYLYLKLILNNCNKTFIFMILFKKTFFFIIFFVTIQFAVGQTNNAKTVANDTLVSLQSSQSAVVAVFSSARRP